MQKQIKEYFNAEDLRYLRVAIALAIGSPDSVNMPKTRDALHVLCEKVERIYHREVNEYQ